MPLAPLPGTSTSSRPAVLACRQDCHLHMVRYRTEHRYLPTIDTGGGGRWDPKSILSTREADISSACSCCYRTHLTRSFWLETSVTLTDTPTSSSRLALSMQNYLVLPLPRKLGR